MVTWLVAGCPQPLAGNQWVMVGDSTFARKLASSAQFSRNPNVGAMRNALRRSKQGYGAAVTSQHRPLGSQRFQPSAVIVVKQYVRIGIGTFLPIGAPVFFEAGIPRRQRKLRE